MRTPPPELNAIMQAAAVRHAVPYTFIAALAFSESHYDILAKPPKPLKDGTYARGLYQFTPAAAEEFGIDPLNPSEATDAAALYTVRMLKKYGWDWKLAICAWNWGPTRVDKAIETGAHIPDEVQSFAEDVLANRRLLQRFGWQEAKKAAAKGQLKLDLGPSALQRLDVAIRELDKANPGWPGVRPVADGWAEWYTPAKGNAPDTDMIKDPYIRYWAAYDEAYDRAPLTPSRIPPPWEIAPSVWTRFAAIASELIDKARAAKMRAKEALDDPKMVITVDDPIRVPAPDLSLLALLAMFVGLMSMRRK